MPKPTALGAACGVVNGDIVVIGGWEAQNFNMIYDITGGSWRSESKAWTTPSDVHGVSFGQSFYVFTG